MSSLSPALALIGARQVGKTSLLTRTFPEAALVTFEPHRDVMGARQDPQLFLAGFGPERQLILDEIQYAPEVTAALKRSIDTDRRSGRFLLTGSQQWAVMRDLSDSLAGRILLLDLEGFTWGEACGQPEPWLPAWLEEGRVPPRRLAGAPTVWEACRRGGLPEAWQMPVEALPDFHQSYITTYIERDARHAGGAGDWLEFARFVRLCAAATGQEVNRAQLGRELGFHGDTVKRWLGLLAGTCQVHLVEPWSGNAVKRLSHHPKLHWADAGLACQALMVPAPLALASHPRAGAIFETAVAGDLRRQAAVMPLRPRFHHWRSHGGAEVDLLLEWNGRLFPIEIKLDSQPGARDLRGIRALRQTHPGLIADRALIIAPVEQAYSLAAGVSVVPWDAAP